MTTAVEKARDWAWHVSGAPHTVPSRFFIGRGGHVAPRHPDGGRGCTRTGNDGPYRREHFAAAGGEARAAGWTAPMTRRMIALVGLLLAGPTQGTAGGEPARSLSFESRRMIADTARHPVSQLQQIVLASGSTIMLPPGFVHQALTSKDSSPGRLVSQDSSLVIDYDMGFLAGARVHPAHRTDFLWFFEHEVNGNRSYTGLFMVGQQRRLATTVLGDFVSPDTMPANFVASVRDERDVAAFMAIVTSYRPRPGK